MSSWVSNNIQSEISGLVERGYYNVYDSWNNPYSADQIIEKSCYHIRSEYEQKSSVISVLEKSFD